MSYVKNSWYVAGWDEEFSSGKPIARTLLDHPLVLFRTKDGNVAALVDRCPHRAVPLSMGTLTPECRIKCPYHGLEFDSKGICVHNPHIAGAPGRLSTPHFATATKHGAIWLWNGDPEAADPSRIPDYSYLDQPGYAVVHGLMNVKANFRLVIDNLLDLSHAEYIHQNTVGTPGASASVKALVEVGDNQLTVYRRLFNLPPSAVFKPYWHKTERIDQYSNMTWFAPSNLKLNLAITAPKPEEGFKFNPDDGYHFPSAHLLTPQSESSTLYFYAIARNFMVKDEGLSEKIRQFFVQAFEGEDRPVIEAVQRRLADDVSSSFRFADFTPGDGAASRARRMIEKLLETV